MPNGHKQFASVCASIKGGPVEVASVLGVSRAFVDLLKSGKRKPSLRLAFAIERAYGVSAKAWIDPIRSQVTTVKQRTVR